MVPALHGLEALFAHEQLIKGQRGRIAQDLIRNACLVQTVSEIVGRCRSHAAVRDSLPREFLKILMGKIIAGVDRNIILAAKQIRCF